MTCKSIKLHLAPHLQLQYSNTASTIAGNLLHIMYSLATCSHQIQVIESDHHQRFQANLTSQSFRQSGAQFQPT